MPMVGMEKFEAIKGGISWYSIISSFPLSSFMIFSMIKEMDMHGQNSLGLTSLIQKKGPLQIRAIPTGTGWGIQPHHVTKPGAQTSPAPGKINEVIGMKMTQAPMWIHGSPHVYNVYSAHPWWILDSLHSPKPTYQRWHLQKDGNYPQQKNSNHNLSFLHGNEWPWPEVVTLEVLRHNSTPRGNASGEIHL